LIAFTSIALVLGIAALGYLVLALVRPEWF